MEEIKDVFVGEIKERYVPSSEKLPDVKITDSESVVKFFREIWEMETIEVFESFYVIYLNRANKPVAWSRISTGGLAGCVADPRMIIRRAILSNASGIILAHNHPSGSLNASRADIAVTKKIARAATYFKMKVLDHIILTVDSHYSFAKNRIM